MFIFSYFVNSLKYVFRFCVSHPVPDPQAEVVARSRKDTNPNRHSAALC